MARRDLLVFLGALAVGSVAMTVFHDAKPNYDGIQYLRMAEHPLARTPPPYLTRVLVPAVVTALPLSARAGFVVVTLVCLAASATLLRRLLLAVGLVEDEALVGVAVFGVTGASISIVHPFLIDAPTFALLFAALLVAVTSRWWWLIAIAPAAFLVRDSTVALIAPAVAIAGWRDRERSVRPIATATIVTAVVVVVVMFTGLLFGSPPPRQNNFTASYFRHILEYERIFGSLPKVIVATLVFTFGGLWAAPFVRARDAAGRLLVLSASAAVAVMLTPFVTDWLRSLLFTAPLVCACVGLAVGASRARGAVAIAATGLLVFVVQPLDGSGAKAAAELALVMCQVAALMVRPGARRSPVYEAADQASP